MNTNLCASPGAVLRTGDVVLSLVKAGSGEWEDDNRREHMC